MTSPPRLDVLGDCLASLLRASHSLTAEQLPRAADQHARMLGFQGAVVYLVDYEQVKLLPLQGPGVPARQEIWIDFSIPGESFRYTTPTHLAMLDGLHHLWVPLLDGAERLGLVEYVTTSLSSELEESARALSSLLAELVLTRDAYSDLFARLRRRKTMSLAAEVQWELLPPLTFAAEHLVITGSLEPAYEIGGDTFDYAVNGRSAHFLVLDAVGHGLPAALLASAAVGTYRHARREMLDLTEIAEAVGATIAEQFDSEKFATALLAHLDTETGELRWVNAGHPGPLVLRAGGLFHPSGREPDVPLGLLTGPPAICTFSLEPGDWVLLYTDGIVEARSPTGDFFGEERLSEFLTTAAAEGLPAPETLRRLTRRVLEYQGGQLQDDASMVLLEWSGGGEAELRI